MAHHPHPYASFPGTQRLEMLWCAEYRGEQDWGSRGLLLLCCEAERPSGEQHVRDRGLAAHGRAVTSTSWALVQRS